MRICCMGVLKPLLIGFWGSYCLLVWPGGHAYLPYLRPGGWDKWRRRSLEGAEEEGKSERKGRCPAVPPRSGRSR